MPEYARVCKSMPEYARVCQSMPEYARVCQSMPEYARVCQSMPEYARVCQSRVAEVAREHGWHPPKSLDWDENFKPEHTLICRELSTFFGDLWAKRVPFWVKTVLLGQEVHYYMVYIAYFTELNSKI